MQDVESHERAAFAADFLHRGRVFAAPGIGEFVGIDQWGMAGEERLRIARNAAAPIDHGSEDIE